MIENTSAWFAAAVIAGVFVAGVFLGDKLSREARALFDDERVDETSDDLHVIPHELRERKDTNAR